MSRAKNILMLCCLAGAVWGCAPRPGAERAADVTDNVAELLPDQPTDPAIVTAEPTLAHTVFANDWVRVARVTLAPDELIPPHEAGTRYVYPLSECTLSIIDNGTEEIVNFEPGELATWSAGRLGVANVGESNGEFLVVERSPIETSPDLETLPIPDVAIDMERHGTVLLDNDDVMAVDIRLTRLESDPLPAYLPMLVVGLSDCSLELQGPDGSTVEEVLENGEAVWLTAGYGAVVNAGDGEAHVLVLALKK
jgi:hypothetical protein